MSEDDGVLTGEAHCGSRLEVHYQFPGRGTKYYFLTTGSGYPSAEFRFPLSPDRRQVVPEAAKSSANPPPEE